MQRPNNIMQAIQQVKKQIGNGDPNTYLQNFIEQNRIPQNMLNEAQNQAKQLMEIMGIK